MISETNPVVAELDALIRSRSPIIAISSHEEQRVIETVISLAASERHNKVVYTWSISNGMVRVWPIPAEGEASPANTELSDPVAALKYVLENDLSKPSTSKTNSKSKPDLSRAIFIFKDLHRYLYDNVVVRLLRDVASTLRTRHQTVVLVSPSFGGWANRESGGAEGSFGLPVDLEHDVASVDFPLPTHDELSSLLDRFIDNAPKGVTIHLDESRGAVIRALQGLPETEADSALAQAVIAQRGRLDEQAIGIVLKVKSQIIKRTKSLEYFPEQLAYGQIGGVDRLKAWCAEADLALSDAAQKYGVRAPRGLLLVGVAGCGKSMIAKAVAGGKRPLLRWDIGAMKGPLVGQSEAQTRQTFKIAEAVAPVVLWADEIEKSFGGNSVLDGGVEQNILGDTLTFMQETREPVFIVATSNDAHRLPAELIQRFDAVFFVDLPVVEERVQIFNIHLAGYGRDPQVFDVQALAEAAEQFSGREIERVLRRGLLRAFTQGHEVTTDDLLSVVGDIVPLAVTEKDKVARMREWAELAEPASSRQQSGHHYSPTGNKLALEV